MTWLLEGPEVEGGRDFACVRWAAESGATRVIVFVRVDSAGRIYDIQTPHRTDGTGHLELDDLVVRRTQALVAYARAARAINHWLARRERRRS